MSATAVLPKRLTSTVARELAVAVSGLLLVGFILSHLAANLLIFAGPEYLNAYAENMRGLGPLLYVARTGLLVVFVVHIALAIQLAMFNRKARSQAYAVETYKGRKGAATRYMLFSGLMLLAFVLMHLTDFTLREHHGPNAMVGGEDLGLYGLVWNFLGNPVRGIFYIAAVCALGLHLSHAISSVVVTLGWLSETGTKKAEAAAKVIGIVIALGFSSIPIYILLKTYVLGGHA